MEGLKPRSCAGCVSATWARGVVGTATGVGVGAGAGAGAGAGGRAGAADSARFGAADAGAGAFLVEGSGGTPSSVEAFDLGLPLSPMARLTGTRRFSNAASSSSSQSKNGYQRALPRMRPYRYQCNNDAVCFRHGTETESQKSSVQVGMHAYESRNSPASLWVCLHRATQQTHRRNTASAEVHAETETGE
jgi:hypothetical protein